MSDLLVILGAGASYDAVRDGFERPPLATNLFDDTYDEIQRHFPGVDGLRGTIRAKMNRGQNLESILGELAQNKLQAIRRQVVEIPVYLKVLISKFTGGNRPGTYDELITLKQLRGLSATFVTLNYDTLLDEAISRKYGPHGAIISLDSYVSDQEGKDWRYIKLHGSVNWGYRTSRESSDYSRIRPLGHDQLDDYGRYLAEHGLSDSENRRRIDLLKSNSALESGGALIYPALAIPTDRKYRPVCPPEHVEALREALRSDPAVLVIGNQGLDTDLMAILSESAPTHSSKPFRVVDKKDAVAVTQRFAEALHRTGYSMYPDMGFKEFVGSEEAERFFDEVAEAKSADVNSRFAL